MHVSVCLQVRNDRPLSELQRHSVSMRPVQPSLPFQEAVHGASILVQDVRRLEENDQTLARAAATRRASFIFIPSSAPIGTRSRNSCGSSNGRLQSSFLRHPGHGSFLVRSGVLLSSGSGAVATASYPRIFAFYSQQGWGRHRVGQRKQCGSFRLKWPRRRHSVFFTPAIKFNP